MELVYLWVEDYKNIHKQGFNFSPRFNCHYDDVTNELTIDENDEYIPDFFGDNINVTAIVGKNGSGKSSVLELIANYEDSKFFQEKNFILIYEKDENFYCIYSLQSVPKCNVEHIKYSHHKEFLKRFNDKDNNWNISTYELASSKPVSGSITYKRLDGSFHSTSTKNKDSYYLSDNQFLIHKYIDIYRNQKQVIQKLKNICTFDTLRIVLKHRQITIFDSYPSNNSSIVDIIAKTKSIMNKFYEEHRKIKEKFPQALEYYNNYRRLLAPNLFIAMVDYFLKNACMETRDNRDECYVTFINALQSLEDNIEQSQHDFIIHEKIYIFILELEESINDKKFKKGANLFKAINFLIKVSDEIREKDAKFYYDFNLNNIDIDEINLINIVSKMFDDEQKIDIDESLRIFELDLINSETQVEYKTISDGEQQFLKVTIDFFTQLPYVAQMTENKSHIFLSDEIDESLHPEWKRNMISHLVDILRIYTSGKENIFLHFIFTTHSPFLLSDIPKQNIIFLDKDENGNCKVVNGLKDIKQTFGANIHTLLSDSFFMEDGLMGEFAKSKIDQIIKNLNDEGYNPERKEKENILLVIKSIGEPFLKNKIQDMYYKKFTDEYLIEARKKELLEEQAKIETELKKYD